MESKQLQFEFQSPSTLAYTVVVLTPEESSKLGLLGKAASSRGDQALSPRIVSGGTWSRGQRCVALLTRIGQSGAIDLCGFGTARAKKRGNGASDRGIEILEVESRAQKLPWKAIESKMPPDCRGFATSRLHEKEAAPLPVRISSAISVALEALLEVEEWQRLSMRLTPQSESSDAGMRDRRDRLVTAIKLFGATLGDLPDVVSGEKVPDKLRRLESIWETQIIREDSRVLLPDWARLDAPDAWYKFQRGSREMFLREIHVDRGESLTGGDLVYVRRRPDAALLVQYKRLTLNDRADVARCPIDERFRKQLAKLTRFGENDEPFTARSPEDYRMNGGAGWVKLIEDRPYLRGEGQVYEGYYFPAAYFLSLLDQSESSFLDLNLKEDRTISSDLFIRLASAGWIGTPGRATSDIAKLLRSDDIVLGEGPVTLAIEI